MQDDALFPIGAVKPGDTVVSATPRVQRPERNQVEFFNTDIDSLIPDEHEVRVVWEYAEAADLSTLYGQIKAFEGRAGRTPIDPRILLALWLYATLRGVGSARQLDVLCHEHLAYRWLCGNVSVNYHTLADFRAESGTVFDALLSAGIARLRSAGLVTLERVAHDGIRVRASAGSGSFRSKKTLDRFRQEADEQVRVLKAELHDAPGASTARQKAARKRAAEDRVARVKAALTHYPEVYAKRKKDKDETRVSVTDADARKMKMADGGFRPAYNVQLSADTGSQIIVGASVSQAGGDYALMVPAVQQIEAQSGRVPKELLCDGGFAKPESVEELSQAPYVCTVYAPPPVLKDKTGQTLERKKAPGPGEAQWRERMALESSTPIYRQRASTIECVNALARNRGLQQFRVRGKTKVYATVLLFALVHNLMREQSLKREKAERCELRNTG